MNKDNIAMPFITDFLTSVEGPTVRVGYIPCFRVDQKGNQTYKNGKKITENYKGEGAPWLYRVMGVSGVTIGKGVDLGQTSASVLESFGLSYSHVSELFPYIGKKGNEAIHALHVKPLTVTQKTAETLTEGMLWHHASLISSRYDREAGVGAFETLPKEAQAAIFSILYQRGVNSTGKYANTWKAFLSRNWKDASKRLCTADFWDDYKPRRALEGKLLTALF